MNELITKLQEAMEIAQASPAQTEYSIGIGITTHNRYDMFKRTYDNILKFAPALTKIVVVDDGSTKPVPEATYRFESAKGIAIAKNKCLEMLDDREHIFLFDDDCYPIRDDWYLPYIQSGEPHLMYIFKDFATGRKLSDTAEVYRTDKLVAYSHPRGPMLYIHNSCLKIVGGMYPVFGKWGYEHPDFSNRVYAAGLTTFRYADVVGSNQLIYSADEHEAVRSTVPPGMERQQFIKANKPIHDSRQHSTEYVEYREKKNIVITTYFTSVPDPQRNVKWKWEPKILEPLIDSCNANGAELHILVDAAITEGGHSVPAQFHEISVRLNPYFQRWFSIRQWIRANKHKLDSVFCVDATDVTMLKNPFAFMEKGVLYTGDEPDTISSPWLKNNHRNTEIQEFIKNDPGRQILNAGLCGGDVETVDKFLTRLIDFYFMSEATNNSCGFTDMGAFNLIATEFNVSHGLHVNTEFKADKINSISWFKHK